MRLILVTLAAAGLCACASPPPTVYAPVSTTTSGTGYEDIQIESDRWRVTFTGAGSTSAAQIERLALRRAGEITLQNGFEWFEVIDRRTREEGEDRSPVRVGGSVGRGWGSGGFSSTGVGLGVSLSPGQQARTTVSLEIIAGAGEPRPDRAYDAASVARPPAPAL